jgi:hypothetical protein
MIRVMASVEFPPRLGIITAAKMSATKMKFKAAKALECLSFTFMPDITVNKLKPQKVQRQAKRGKPRTAA